MEYIYYSLSVFIGVVAGTFVNWATAQVLNKKLKKEKKKQLLFEISFNLKKVADWKTKLEGYRNAINSSDIKHFFDYFDISKAIYPTMYQVYSNGEVSYFFDEKHLLKVQSVYNELTLATEEYINNSVQEQKSKFNKDLALSDIRFWEKKFISYEKHLLEVQEYLENQK